MADREKNICFDFAKRNYLIEKFPIFPWILAGFKLFLVEFMHDTRRVILSREPTQIQLDITFIEATKSVLTHFFQNSFLHDDFRNEKV